MSDERSTREMLFCESLEDRFYERLYSPLHSLIRTTEKRMRRLMWIIRSLISSVVLPPTAVP